MTFDLFIPPIAKIAMRRALKLNVFSGSYPTFEEASANSKGYEETGIVSSIASTTPLPNCTTKSDARTMQVLAAFGAVLSADTMDEISVLDVGGGNGRYFHLIKPLIRQVSSWTVLETCAVAKAAREMNGNAGISFLSDEGALNSQYDLALISGALQYLPDPHAFLKRVSKRCRWILLTRLPTFDDPVDRLTVQQIRSASFPAWFFSRKKIEHTLKDTGAIVMRWDVPEDRGLLDWIDAPYVGYLVRVAS